MEVKFRLTVVLNRNGTLKIIDKEQGEPLEEYLPGMEPAGYGDIKVLLPVTLLYNQDYKDTKLYIITGKEDRLKIIDGKIVFDIVGYASDNESGYDISIKACEQYRMAEGEPYGNITTQLSGSIYISTSSPPCLYLNIGGRTRRYKCHK